MLKHIHKSENGYEHTYPGLARYRPKMMLPIRVSPKTKTQIALVHIDGAVEAWVVQINDRVNGLTGLHQYLNTFRGGAYSVHLVEVNNTNQEWIR